MQAERSTFALDNADNRPVAAQQERQRCEEMGVAVNRVYSLDELAAGNDILFSATGVTRDALL